MLSDIKANISGILWKTDQLIGEVQHSIGHFSN